MIGLLGACALLLGAAGVAKVLRPAPTARAARALDLAIADRLSGHLSVRLLGGLEIVVAVSVLAGGGARAAAALALAYLLLTAVAVRLLTVAPDSDCGCFGTAREPVSRLHVVVNGACALVGVAAVLAPQPAFTAAVASATTSAGVTAGVALVIVVGVLAALLGALMTALPALMSARAKVATP
ncbi:hypothetical protein JL107_12415 [Nakamurella flavida]|uniref:Methylamine utilisation protein MauE domain-containing protein n=1 Tax=Nakamurella flavida TaxID=363630 RepID=A0A938YQ93_9ACTN|nr:MauE/DoxX family redox-associated membrane protein [Nakamurella flavida]MBM9477248.1 hypothetical protein [Nakamurella flavida]MDP9779704.1 hypothetical protein [Nakamurella flavida]